MKRRNLVQAAAALAIAAPLGAMAAPAAPKAAGGKRIAVIFNSRTGHTRSVARAIRVMTGADLYELQLEQPYPDDYRRTTEIVKEELSRNYYRPIKPVKIDLSRYDVVIFGSPTWWHHVAGPVRVWIQSNKPQGKFIATFNDHGGGGEMECRKDYEEMLKGNRLGTHLAIFGEVSESSSEVRLWLKENGLL